MIFLRTSVVLFLTRENKIHIFKPPCNLFLLYGQNDCLQKQWLLQFLAQKTQGSSQQRLANILFLFFCVPVVLLSLVLRQLRLLRQVRAQTAVKKRGNNVGYEKAPLGLLYVVSHEFLRVMYCPVNHSCLYNQKHHLMEVSITFHPN